MKSDEMLVTIENFAKLVESFDAEKLATQDDVSTVDCELQDLLHEIELTSFNASEGYQLARKIKEVLMRRRQIKDCFKIIQLLDDNFIKNNKGIGVTLFKALKNIRNLKESQSKRVYHPRVRTDIKLAREAAT